MSHELRDGEPRICAINTTILIYVHLMVQLYLYYMLTVLFPMWTCLSISNKFFWHV